MTTRVLFEHVKDMRVHESRIVQANQASLVRERQSEKLLLTSGRWNYHTS